MVDTSWVAKGKSIRRKALLAILFVGGLLNSQLPALSDSKMESTDSVLDGIANNEKSATGARAFYLLKLASCYLNEDRVLADSHFEWAAHDRSSIAKFERDSLVPWAKELIVQINHDANPTRTIPGNPPSLASQNSALVEAAIEKALMQLNNVSDKFAKLNLYFIASRLYQEIGDADGMRKCGAVLEEAFKSCERNPLIDEQEISAASSVLNLMTYAIIPVEIPDMPHRLHPNQVPFKETDFDQSMNLRLRAVAMADRLPTTNDLRRRAHRDLALWYLQLGKTELAEKQKQILFEFVGCKDDRILYPTTIFCGREVWWETEKKTGQMGCGMG